MARVLLKGLGRLMTSLKSQAYGLIISVMTKERWCDASWTHLGPLGDATAPLIPKLTPSSTNSRLAGLFPVPSSSSANALFALGVISLFFLRIVSCPPSPSPETFLCFAKVDDDSPIRPGLDVSDRLLGNETGDGGSGNPENWDNGSVSSGRLGRRLIVDIVGRVRLR